MKEVPVYRFIRIPDEKRFGPQDPDCSEHLKQINKTSEKIGTVCCGNKTQGDHTSVHGYWLELSTNLHKVSVPLLLVLALVSRCFQHGVGPVKLRKGLLTALLLVHLQRDREGGHQGLAAAH